MIKINFSKYFSLLIITFMLMLLSGCFWDKTSVPVITETQKDYIAYNEKLPKIEKLWEKAQKDSITVGSIPAPIEYNGDIIMVGLDSAVRLGKNGEVVWRTSIPVDKRGDYDMTASVIENGIICSMHDGAGVLATNAETGNIISYDVVTTTPGIRTMTSVPATYNGKLYFIEQIKEQAPASPDFISDASIVEWDIKERKVLKKVKTDTITGPYTLFQSGLLVENGVLYFVIPAGRTTLAQVVAIEISTFNEKWRKSLPSGFLKYWDSTTPAFAPASVEKGKLIISASKLIIPSNFGVICMNKTNGNVLWSDLMVDEKKVSMVPPPDGDMIFDSVKNRIYYTTMTGDYNTNGKIEEEFQEENIICLDAETGKKLWSKSTGYSISGTPMLKNNILYIPYYGILALNADNGTLVGGWYDGSGKFFSIGFSGETGYALGYGLMAFKPLKPN